MTTTLQFRLPEGASHAIHVERAIVAGWTGRDRAAVDTHIAELAELGVAPPSEVPLFYRVAASLATTGTTMDVVGTGSSGEVEPVLIDDGERLYLGLGSDHTDRELEAHSVALSKQICPKPIAGHLWPYAEIRDHADSLELRSWVRDAPDARWTLYQDGTLSGIRALSELMDRSSAGRGAERLTAGTLMMCGTLPVEGGVRPAPFFFMELRDPVRDRAITHQYETRFLPLVT